ncbi:hypothetical protein AJ80_00524 [Polytolypa hystricis UAMH7299]|uniref:Rad4 beta-hairpin domain-containing protein n=1 Tax=Polytolypa hystricis (strain UAMH7299) TaxID=1447883 RepID=A0A2B7Z4I2_POLH7|nr:hypothetical protein AJ80_00524 [Polytolypa hystricis UAMH7299]
MGKPSPLSARGGRGRPPVRQSTRLTRAMRRHDDIPGVYEEMLAEAESSSAATRTDDRPAKRRRVGQRSERRDIGRGTRGSEDERKLEQESEELVNVADEPEWPTQTIYDIDASEESDMEWEDVEIQDTTGFGQPSQLQPAEREESLQITLEKHDVKEKQRAVPRRKPVTGLEKKWRLDMHKMHVLCLLAHVRLRNSWCNDEEAQDSLRRILSKHIVACLNPKETLPQFSRSTTFADGLKQASDTFKRRFKITAPGMRRPYWLDQETFQSAATVPKDAEMLLSKGDFRKQAAALQGSRDLGAQLFCTLLRAVGVEARLLCSLQVLPFTGVARGVTPVKGEKEYLVVSEDDMLGSTGDSGRGSSASPTPPPTRARRLGQPQFSASPVPTSRPRQTLGLSRGTSESSYPVFWVEAFNEAMQKWVTIDPIVTNTIAKPSRFEPPASDRHNNMSYVIAFEDDASARDVTRRYVKSFNSKTRKNRVEFTKNGEQWWEHTMRVFERPFLEDRDQLELGELTAKVAGETMPRNIQDFKNHPIYALERHLRRNEVIHPKREVGQVSLSKMSPNKKNPALDPVYRRSDVHVVKSADGWYRLGREIKPGEQPLKRLPVSRQRGVDLREELSDYEDEPDETPVYAAFQTELYKPPPIVDNRVIKNAYGNIDVYTPSMIPDGGFYLPYQEAARAARILGIDYADAVTGFQFKGRHGTAVVQGIVASAEYREALVAVIDALEDERVQAEQDRRTAASLQIWKRLLLKLRVAERVKGYRIEGEDEEEVETGLLADEPPADEFGGGGFLPEDIVETAHPANPTAPMAVGESEDPDSPGGGFISESPPLGVPKDAVAPFHPTAGASSAHPQPENASRYTLIVVPNETPSAASPAPNIPSTEQPSSPPASGPSEYRVAPHNQQSETVSSTQLTQSPEASISALVAINSSTKQRSISVEEMSALPDLVHEDSDSEIDQSSMMSHDPEDEDAEPEWLLSD